MKQAVEDRGQFRLAMRYGEKGSVPDLQLACEIVQTLEPRNALLFMELAIGVALSDGILGNAEAYLILFFADLVKVSQTQLDLLFKAATGHYFPMPGDPSTRAWWHPRDARRQAESTAKAAPPPHEWSEYDCEEPNYSALSWAHARLGVSPQASSVEVRDAYFRLVKVNHPDRFHHLGPDAVRVATRTFKTIKDAYEALGAP